MGKTICVCGGEIVDRKCKRCKTSKRPARTERSAIKNRCYRTAEWIKYSIAFRERFPVCAHCERAGRVTAISKGDKAGQVDHIKPFADMADPLFWDEANHQGLCVKCHGEKTWLETRGRYTAKMIRQDLQHRKLQIDAFNDDFG